MTIYTLAFGKASASGSLKLATLSTTRLYSTAPAPVTAPTNGSGAAQSKPKDAATQRELFMNVLNANATKRDAKQYLARFNASKKSSPAPKLSPLQEQRNARHRKDQDRLDRLGVNLGGLYTPARAIAESPQFTQQKVEERGKIDQQQVMHVALVCLRNPEALDDATLDGVALTLSQLVKLDMRLVVLLDCDDRSHVPKNSSNNTENAKHSRDTINVQGERLTQALAQHSSQGARVVSGAIETQDSRTSNDNDAHTFGPASVRIPKLIMDPLKRCLVPIIPKLAYTPTGQQIQAPASAVMSALTHLLSGLPKSPQEAPSEKSIPHTSLDRIILLDSAGGIPSKARADGAHVFINLEQEYEDIQAELAEYDHRKPKDVKLTRSSSVYRQHQENLRMMQQCLAMLPSASSALIVTPDEAASSARAMDSTDSTIGTGTRRQKNTLIHNLLTNKPTVSSSLPVARLPTSSSPAEEPGAVEMPTATLVKRGMPVTIIPSAPRGEGWQLPATGETTLSLENDPQIDLSRLVYLIEDSFRRKLDVKHYLNRIQNRIAGLIIAGEYEGGAILTWEQPAGTSDPSRLVPYLDKFAVLASSQGSSGVADILFQAMVRTCFPNGVCWRSRKDNPVNKWYFERADGHWQIPGTNWTMFWTGEGVVENVQKWEDYVSICTNVGPSWADKGRKPD